MHGISMRENREVPPSSHSADHRMGRPGNAVGGTPGMHGGGKSDRPVVPANPPNKGPAVVGVAEAGEERGVRRDKPAWRRRWKSSTPKV